LLLIAIGAASAAVLGSARFNSSTTNASATAPFDAAALYNSKCAKCHGRDGRAQSLHAKHVHARDLTAADWQNDVSDERIYNSISNGKGKMPSFKKSLSEDQINSLVTYVRRLRK
jgi:mono/diheme cytochrome c family protein